MGLSTSVLLIIVLAPLLGSVLAGFLSPFLGRAGRVAAHSVTILGLLISVVLSFHVLYQLTLGGAENYNQNIYTWFQVGHINASVGFMVDRLTAMMLVVVGFVSLLVHLYTIGYMRDDPGYTRFFSYISLFTFSMFMLVMSNNFMQLFFGWEAVGLVSYLLIGFWYKRPTAIFANLKAFMVNRVGDFGFLLGIAAVLYFLGTLDYATAFAGASGLVGQTLQITANTQWNAATVICILLFIGAMGKSAQVPLHVWLPDSMEGPTPISALIHAATMVTAGIFMVARMSPLFELSETALSFVMIIGATGALFTGLIGIVQNDIKRVVAYSTLSQLGYMTVALGVSAYSAAVYHLMTHAFFKALLFLAAGSVIIGMHHEQDMRKMGGLRKVMPITFWTSLIGTLALVGTPFFAGFYSKDTIIEAAAEHAHEAHGWIATYGYWSVLLGAFVTALYSFRLMYLTFAGKPRWHDAAPEGYVVPEADSADHEADLAHEHEDHAHGHDDHAHEPHESPWVVTIPLILLAIPSAIIGFLTIGPMLFGTDMLGHAKRLPFFLGSIDVAPAHDVMGKLAEEFHGPLAYAWHGFAGPAFWLALAGFLVATIFYWWKPELHSKAREFFSLPVRILQDKYGMDALWIRGFAGGGIQAGRASRVVDEKVIDGAIVNGSVRFVDIAAGVLRGTQSGYLYHYAFAMILGLIAMLAALMWFWR